MSGVSAMQVQCPECESSINVPRSRELWDTFPCPRCHTKLQIIDDSPFDVDYADVDEDVDDGFDDFDDEY
jgi:uncharacterized paraquat-inducible protein A